jgi:hypothetical protein
MTDKITPKALRALLERAGITQARAAYLCHARLRSMEQWVAGDRAMPRSAVALLCWSLYALDKLPIYDALMWHHRDVLAGLR